MAQPAGSILEERPKALPVIVQKPTPYTFDLGLLLANDPNPLIMSSSVEESLSATARDGAQALLNQLLTTCPISSTDAGVLLSLPQITTALPREKALPTARAATKWERFAAKKGIKPKSAAARQKLRYDAAAGAWVPRWGYKGANKAPERDWLVEVDDRKERELPEGATLRGLNRRERKERVKRGERRMRANERKGRKPVE